MTYPDFIEKKKEEFEEISAECKKSIAIFNNSTNPCCTVCGYYPDGVKDFLTQALKEAREIVLDEVENELKRRGMREEPYVYHEDIENAFQSLRNKELVEIMKVDTHRAAHELGPDPCGTGECACDSKNIIGGYEV